jgi:hypothetical protein
MQLLHRLGLPYVRLQPSQYFHLLHGGDNLVNVSLEFVQAGDSFYIV